MSKIEKNLNFLRFLRNCPEFRNFEQMVKNLKIENHFSSGETKNTSFKEALGNEWACTISAISSSGQALGNEWACPISAVLLVFIKKNNYFLCSFSIIPFKSHLAGMPTRCPELAQSSESQIWCMPTRCPESPF